MNATLCKPCVVTDAELNICDTPNLQEDFATRPMQAIQPEYTPLDEEAMHISFEEAISERITALGINWSRMATTEPLRPTNVERAVARATASSRRGRTRRVPAFPKSWQLPVTYTCLALMFMLVGFDLMGLLILCGH